MTEMGLHGQMERVPRIRDRGKRKVNIDELTIGEAKQLAEIIARLEGAAQRFVDARRLLECSRFYSGSPQQAEYVNAEQIAADELKTVLEGIQKLALAALLEGGG